MLGFEEEGYLLPAYNWWVASATRNLLDQVNSLYNGSHIQFKIHEVGATKGSGATTPMCLGCGTCLGCGCPWDVGVWVDVCVREGLKGAWSLCLNPPLARLCHNPIILVNPRPLIRGPAACRCAGTPASTPTC